MAEITNKLLKEAIADAEAVRETAVANAKMVLEEAITPQIRDMIARRLRVEAEDVATQKPHEDGEPVGSSESPADSSTVGSGENKEPSDDAFAASDIGDGGENKEDSHTDWYDDWSESDFDLDEVIKELEEDIAALSEGDDEEASDEKEDEHGEEKEDEKKDHSPMKEGEAHGDDDEEIDLEEILAELEAEEDEEGHESEEMPSLSPSKPGEEEKKQMAAELARIKNELAQHRMAVNTLRERLQEVNLLNAKLLFTNKMFRKEGLNNEQKIRIVESFDRATTVREVKLVYTALVENLSTAAKTFAASRKKVVAEGFASKATPSTAPKAEVIVENTVAKRLQELAGIIS